MKKSTLFLSFDGLSDPLGQSQILPYLCGIAQNGYQINIISCEKQTRLKNEFDNIQKIIKDLPINWQYISYKESGGFLLRIIYILRLYQKSKNIIKEKQIGLVHCRSYLTSLIGLRLKQKYNIPFIFDMRGFWADERIDGGIWSKNHFLHQLFYKFFKKKEKQFLENADAIVSLTHAGLNELNLKFPEYLLSKKTSIIPCCTNCDLFKPTNQINGIKINGLDKDDHVVIYTGSIGTWYFTKEMIDCILVWKKFIPNIKFLILTKDQDALSQILKNYSVEQQNIVISTSAAYNEVVNYLSLAKAALFFIKPSYSKIASSPTKMAECWALDLPIITNAGIGDNDLYFNKYQGGVLLNAFTEEAYENACSNYLNLKQEKNHYRKIALDYFDNKMAIKSYTEIYNQLT